MQWIKGDNNLADMETKNHDHASNRTHTKVFQGNNDKLLNVHLKIWNERGYDMII